MALRSELESILTLHHICMELTGVISEFRSMPCSSLEQRMFATVDRYQRRISENAPTEAMREELRKYHLELKEANDESNS